MSHSRTTSNGTIKLLQWCGSSMQSCHLLCVSWAEPVRWIVTATDELLWMESPKKPGREFCFPPFFCSNKDVSSLWDNYWKITGVHPPVERCSCTVLMGPWSCSHLLWASPCCWVEEPEEESTHWGYSDSQCKLWNFHLSHHSQKWGPGALKLPGQVEHGPSVCISLQHMTHNVHSDIA